MKILFISHNFFPAIGGIEVNSLILATAFSEAGHLIRLVTWTPDPEGAKFPFQVCREPGLLTLLKLHKWADTVFENNPSLRLSWPNIFFSRPQVIAVRTMIIRADGTTGIQDLIKKTWLKKASKVIAVSEAIRSKCYLKADVIGNPYRVELFKILPDIPRTRNFVFMGRLVSEKGVDLAIKSVYQINERKSGKFNLSIIGDGPERRNLEDLVRELKMEDYVQFTGTLRGEELTTCLNRHRYMLIPSRCEEAFGNVALEGIACGCIPIVSDAGGLPAAVGPAGLTFKSGEITSLVSTIDLLIREPLLQADLLMKANVHLDAHKPEVIAKQYLKAVEEAFTEKEYSFK